MGTAAATQEVSAGARLTRAERKTLTRNALIQAARAVVARRGMQAATHEEIAAEAGLTIGAIYSNFANKADLMAALMDDVARRGSVTLEDKGSIVASLEALGRRIARTVDEDPSDVDLQLEFTLFAIRVPEAAQRRRPHHDTEHEGYAQLLDRLASASGEPLPMPAREFAETVSNLAWSLMVSRRTLGASTVTDDYIVRALMLLATTAA